MPTSPAKWLGARRLTLKPDGVTVDYTDRLSAALEYQGPYELCLANRPARGAIMPGFAGMAVDRTVVRRSQAPGFGELSVYLSADTDDDTEGTGDPITEIYWLEVEKDLYEHDLFISLGRADRRRIELWKQQDDPTKYDSYTWERLSTTGAVLATGTLSGSALAYAAKFAVGIDSFLFYTPVATLTTFSRAKPSAVRVCGKRITGKPFAACPSGYTWLRTADRHTRSGRHGKWQRTQTFTGGVNVDTSLYEAES